MIPLMIRTFNYGFEFQIPKHADTCQVIYYAKQAVGMCQFCTFVILDLFHSYNDYFLQNNAIKHMKCQHNLYLKSIKTSITCTGREN